MTHPTTAWLQRKIHSVAVALLMGGLVPLDTRAAEASENQGRWASEWRELKSKENPTARCRHTVTLDVTGQRLILVGGEGILDEASGSTWILDLTTEEWVQLKSQDEPQARRWHTVTLDPVRQRLLLIGGHRAWGHSIKDHWALNLKTGQWFPIERKDMDDSTLPSRYNHTATLDPLGQRLIVVGGQTSRNFEIDDVTWVLDLTSDQWHELESKHEPPPRYSHTATFDIFGQRLIVVGGFQDKYDKNGMTAVAQPLRDTWSLELMSDQWQKLESQRLPPARARHEAILDPFKQRLLVVGGQAITRKLNDTWMLDLRT